VKTWPHASQIMPQVLGLQLDQEAPALVGTLFSVMQ